MPRTQQQKLADCPKCKGEQSMMTSAHLKWNVQDKWVYLQYCQLCGYETDGKS